MLKVFQSSFKLIINATKTNICNKNTIEWEFKVQQIAMGRLYGV